MRRFASNSLCYLVCLASCFFNVELRAQLNSWQVNSPFISGLDYNLFAWSSNKQFMVRIDPGRMKDGYIEANVYRSDDEFDRYAFVSTTIIPYKFRPSTAFVTDDGHYLICLNRFTSKSQLKNAIVVKDLKNEDVSTLDLEQIYAVDSFRQNHTIFRQNSLFWYSEFFSKDRKLYILGFQGKDGAPPPQLMIDLDDLSVEVLSVPFFPTNAINHETVNDFYTFITVEQEHLYELAGQIQELPTTQFVNEENDIFFRMAVGSNKSRPSFSIFKIDSKTKDFKLTKKVDLKNSVSPDAWFCSEDLRYLITFDEYNRIGVTDNTIVIYDLEKDISKSFALEDFCSEQDLKNMAQSEKIRFWRIGKSWVTIKGTTLIDWHPQKLEGLAPHVVIDVEEMSVRLAEPFVSKYR